jgi:hypothetical protein
LESVLDKYYPISALKYFCQQFHFKGMMVVVEII